MRMPYVNPEFNLSKSVALVGSSGSLLKHEYGEIIDKHENVIRFNRAPVEGYEKIAGSKTTIRVANNHVFLNKPINSKFTNQPQNFIKNLKDTRVLLIGPIQFNLKNKTRQTDESNELFIFDYNKINILKKEVKFKVTDNPSVGLIAICLCVIAGVKPDLFGFDISLDQTSRSHYWENRPGAGPIHKVSYEKQFIKELENQKLVSIYG